MHTYLKLSGWGSLCQILIGCPYNIFCNPHSNQQITRITIIPDSISNEIVKIYSLARDHNYSSKHYNNILSRSARVPSASNGILA